VTYAQCQDAPIPVLSWPISIFVRSPRSSIGGRSNTSIAPCWKLSAMLWLSAILSRLLVFLPFFFPCSVMVTLASVPAHHRSLVFTLTSYVVRPSMVSFCHVEKGSSSLANHENDGKW